MSSYDEHLEFVTRDILSTFCGMDGSRSPRLASSTFDSPRIVSVAYAGAFAGELVLEYTPDCGRALTARTMETSPGALSEAEIVDVLREFVNIAAGNLKAVLPRPTTFSLPRTQERVHEGVGELAGQTTLEVDGEAMRLCLYSLPSAA